MELMIWTILKIKPAWIGIAAGVLTALSLLPQLYKMVKEKKGDHISRGMLAILLGGLLLWIYYGYLKKDWPLVATNGLSLMVNIMMIRLSVLYRNDDKENVKTD